MGHQRGRLPLGAGHIGALVDGKQRTLSVRLQGPLLDQIPAPLADQHAQGKILPSAGIKAALGHGIHHRAFQMVRGEAGHVS